MISVSKKRKRVDELAPHVSCRLANAITIQNLGVRAKVVRLQPYSNRSSSPIPAFIERHDIYKWL